MIDNELSSAEVERRVRSRGCTTDWLSPEYNQAAYAVRIEAAREYARRFDVTPELLDRIEREAVEGYYEEDRSDSAIVAVVEKLRELMARNPS